MPLSFVSDYGVEADPKGSLQQLWAVIEVRGVINLIVNIRSGKMEMCIILCNFSFMTAVVEVYSVELALLG